MAVEAGEAARTTLRDAGFRGAQLEGIATTAFDAGDFAAFLRYPKAVPWKPNYIPEEDQQIFKSIRSRLESLADGLAPAVSNLPGCPSMTPFASLFETSGKLVTQPWCCIYPSQARHKSYALQVALILSANGAELCLCLGAGKSTIKEPRRSEAEEAWKRLRKRLASVPVNVTQSVEQALPSRAVLRTSWKDPGDSQFESVKEWVEYASGPEGGQASISVFLSVAQMETLQARISDAFLEIAEAAAPLFEHCYNPPELPHHPQVSGAEDTISAEREEPTAVLPAADFDADTLQKLAAADPYNLELDPKVYRAVIAALRSGKHIILTGPPGTAKTTLAEVVGILAHSAGLCSGSVLTTATSDWTTYDTIGGLRPAGSGSLEFHDGLILDAIRKNQWLLIDELNRSNFDRAFGQLFTVLSGQPVALPWENQQGRRIVLCPEGETRYPASSYERIAIPLAWRIVATMNVFDKSLLFEMSFALMRRFAFIEVPSPEPAVFETLWNRRLEDMPAGPAEIIGSTLHRLLALTSVKDIGPAVFIDMAGFARQYLTTDTDVAADQLAFQLFYSYLLPQYEGITEQQGRDLFNQVDVITQRQHTRRLARTLADVLGITLPAGERVDGEDEYDHR